LRLEKHDNAKACLRKNDVILSLNGAKMADAAALRQQTQESPAGKSLKLGVSRDQKELLSWQFNKYPFAA